MAAPLLPVPKWLVNRVKLWVRRLRLDAQWEVTVEMTEYATTRGGIRNHAFTGWVPGYSRARMQFSRESYDKMSPREVDRLICHELYHLATAREDDHLAEDIGRGKVYENHAMEAEHCADFFANAITRAYARKKE